VLAKSFYSSVGEVGGSGQGLKQELHLLFAQTPAAAAGSLVLAFSWEWSESWQAYGHYFVLAAIPSWQLAAPESPPPHSLMRLAPRL